MCEVPGTVYDALSHSPVVSVKVSCLTSCDCKVVTSMSLHSGVECVSESHNATGSVKVSSEVNACHSVCRSGLEGACANVTLVGLTKMSVVVGTVNPCWTSDYAELVVLSWCLAMTEDAGNAVVPSRLDSVVGAIGETIHADVGHSTSGTMVSDGDVRGEC